MMRNLKQIVNNGVKVGASFLTFFSPMIIPSLADAINLELHKKQGRTSVEVCETIKEGEYLSESIRKTLHPINNFIKNQKQDFDTLDIASKKTRTELIYDIIGNLTCATFYDPNIVSPGDSYCFRIKCLDPGNGKPWVAKTKRKITKSLSYIPPLESIKAYHVLTVVTSDLIFTEGYVACGVIVYLSTYTEYIVKGTSLASLPFI